MDHQRARDWIEAEIAYGWASCAITQNGFVRIVSQPRYPSPISPAEAIDRLARATHTEHHEFWPCSISLIDDHVVDAAHLHGSRQVTDAYLLALATNNDARLATFDQSVPLSAVPAANVANLTIV